MLCTVATHVTSTSAYGVGMDDWWAFILDLEMDFLVGGGRRLREIRERLGGFLAELIFWRMADIQ